MKNYYKLLGVSPDASNEEIKQAYRLLVSEYQPKDTTKDRYAGNRVIDISIAYNTLINIEKRKDYDRILSCIILNPQQLRESEQFIPNDAKYQQNNSVALKRSKTRMLNFTVACLSLLGVTFIYTHNNRISKSFILNKLETSTVAPLTAGNQNPIHLKPVEKNAAPSSTSTSANASLAVNSEKKPIKKILPAEKQNKQDEDAGPLYNTVADLIARDSYLKTGLTKNEIIKIQGTPTTIIRFDANTESWCYSSSMINFKNDLAVSFENRGGNLLLKPEKNSANTD